MEEPAALNKMGLGERGLGENSRIPLTIYSFHNQLGGWWKPSLSQSTCQTHSTTAPLSGQGNASLSKPSLFSLSYVQILPPCPSSLLYTNANPAARPPAITPTTPG